MPSPVEGVIHTKGDKKTLTFILGFDLTALTTHNGFFKNLTSNNNVSYNNTQITVADNTSGVVTISANLSEVGEWVGYFTGSNATLSTLSPTFYFKVVNPVS